MSETASNSDRDYIIGVTAAEIERLGSQHAVWRDAALSAWDRAGLKPGMHVADIGCGPGYAAMDLAERVGPTGHVTCLDQSRTFLAHLADTARARGLAHIETLEADLAGMELAEARYDMIWCRWVLSFVPEPEMALRKLVAALKPGGRLVLQEYCDYRTFRITPHDGVLDRFLDAVQASWVAGGGDSNVARRFPSALQAMGCPPTSMTPLVYAAGKGTPVFNWPWTWISQAPDRLVELGFLDPGVAAEFRSYLERIEAEPFAWLITPMVMEIIATRD